MLLLVKYFFKNYSFKFPGNLFVLISLATASSLRKRTASIFIINLCVSIIPVCAIFLTGLGIGTVQRMSEEGVTLNKVAKLCVTAMAVMCKQVEVHTIMVIAVHRLVITFDITENIDLIYKILICQYSLDKITKNGYSFIINKYIISRARISMPYKKLTIILLSR